MCACLCACVCVCLEQPGRAPGMMSVWGGSATPVKTHIHTYTHPHTNTTCSVVVSVSQCEKQTHSTMWMTCQSAGKREGGKEGKKGERKEDMRTRRILANTNQQPDNMHEEGQTSNKDT